MRDRVRGKCELYCILQEEDFTRCQYVLHVECFDVCELTFDQTTQPSCHVSEYYITCLIMNVYLLYENCVIPIMSHQTWGRGEIDFILLSGKIILMSNKELDINTCMLMAILRLCVAV